MKSKTPRAICLEILQRIEKTDRPLDTLLTDSFKRYRHLTSLDRAFLTELTYGTLRWRGKLDWVIRDFSRTPFPEIEPEILNPLRMALYQIHFMTRTPASAAVNESVELTKKFRGRGGAAFVNAVLRSALREKENMRFPGREEDPVLHTAVVQSHPLWLVKRWVESLGAEETLRVCEANNQIAPLVVRTNGLRLGRKDLIARLGEKGLEGAPTRHADEGIVLKNPPPTSDLPFLKEGLFVLQDEASQLVAPILDPQPGEKILDACAAPGGKTTHMAQRMRNQGEIWALDLSRQKLNRVEEICERFGVGILKTRKADASRPLPFGEEGRFDRILADVPCSGFGTLRRNPDLKWRKGEKEIRRLGQLQSSILENLAGYLKPGGVLVYSTCTVFREENEDVIEGFLEGHPEFRLDPPGERLPESCLPFIENGSFRTFPGGNAMDGFFVARLIRNQRS